MADRFLGGNALLAAEVERARPVADLVDAGVLRPEVSEDDRFRNEYLPHHPLGGWAPATGASSGQRGRGSSTASATEFREH